MKDCYTITIFPEKIIVGVGMPLTDSNVVHRFLMELGADRVYNVDNPDISYECTRDPKKQEMWEEYIDEKT